MLSKLVKQFKDRIQKLRPESANLSMFYEHSDEFVEGQFAEMMDQDFYSVFGSTLPADEKWHW